MQHKTMELTAAGCCRGWKCKQVEKVDRYMEYGFIKGYQTQKPC